MNYRFKTCSIDSERLELRRDGTVIDVEPQVFTLMLFLIENREKVVSKDELFEAVWQGRIVSDATLNSRINALRKALGDSGKAQDIVRTYPRRGFRFIADLDTAETGNKIKDVAAPRPNTAIGDKPSIAVLPFRMLAETEARDYVAAGVSEEIVTALSRMHWLLVISQTSSQNYGDPTVSLTQIRDELGADYVLSGTVQLAGDQVRVSAQLTATRTSAKLWAERFQGHLTGIFELQDQIAYAVATCLEPEITRAESERLGREVKTGDLTAWEHYMRAVPHTNRLEKEGNEIARAELLKAIDIDPEFVLPHVALAWCWALAALHGWHERGSEALRQSRLHGENALQLDPGDARAHCAMAFAAFWSGDQQGAIKSARQSLDIDPNMADAYGILGSALAVSGSADEGIKALERALRGSPRDPIRWFWFHSLANACFARSNYVEAAEWAAKSLQLRRDSPIGHMVRASALWFSGDHEKAAEEIKTLRAFGPHHTLHRIGRNPIWADDEAFARLLEGVRGAGLE